MIVVADVDGARRLLYSVDEDDELSLLRHTVDLWYLCRGIMIMSIWIVLVLIVFVLFCWPFFSNIVQRKQQQRARHLKTCRRTSNNHPDADLSVIHMCVSLQILHCVWCAISRFPRTRGDGDDGNDDDNEVVDVVVQTSPVARRQSVAWRSTQHTTTTKSKMPALMYIHKLAHTDTHHTHRQNARSRRN